MSIVKPGSIRQTRGRITNVMGIQDRDYMKGSSGRARSSDTDERVEAFFTGFFQRHKRLLWIVGAILLLLIIAGIVMSSLE